MGQRERAQLGALVFFAKGWFGEDARGSENPVWWLDARFDRQVFRVGGEPGIGDFSLGELAPQTRRFLGDRNGGERA